MKTIKYMGCEYEVPDWAKFIATDEDGDVCVFDMMPDLRENAVLGFWDGKPSSLVRVVGSPGWKWQETLVKIE